MMSVRTWAVAAASLLLVGGIVVAWIFWPEERTKQVALLMSLLQFAGVLALLVVTAIYAQVTYDSTHRKPVITASEASFGGDPPEFYFKFDVVIGNPTVRATRVTIRKVTVRVNAARHVSIGDNYRSAIRIPGAEVMETTATATFWGVACRSR
jgi:hypothetical protein